MYGDFIADFLADDFLADDFLALLGNELLPPVVDAWSRSAEIALDTGSEWVAGDSIMAAIYSKVETILWTDWISFMKEFFSINTTRWPAS